MYICKICQSDFSNYSKKKEWNLKALFSHVKKKHDVDKEQYVLKFVYNNIRPLCKCGCENETSFYKGKYNLYFEDHKNKQKLTTDQKMAITNNLLKRFQNNNEKIGLSEEKLKYLWEQYQIPDNNSEKIKQMSKIDFRTIESWWIKKGIADESLIKKVKKQHKHSYNKFGEQNPNFISIPEEKLIEIKKYLDSMKNSSTRKYVTYTSLARIFDLKISPKNLNKKIEFYFRDEYSNLFRGISSQSELDFLDAVAYFVGLSKVEKQFRLDKYIYDAKIYKNILIEFDGDFWHGEKAKVNKNLTQEQAQDIKNRDIKKDEIAISNGYHIVRISDIVCKNIDKFSEFIKKIMELKNETKAIRYKI